MLPSVESPPWYGVYYTARRIHSLPRQFILWNGTQLVIDYATPADRSSCVAFVRDSATQGRGNVGEDEFEGPYAGRLDAILTTSQIFVARNPDSQQAKAFVVVSPSIYTRTFDCSLAGLYVFLAREFQRDALVFQHLMRLAVEFSQELNLGYTNAVVQVSSSEHDFVRLLRQDGFLRVGTLQGCVKIAGKGLCDSILLAKRLSETSRPRRSSAEILEFADKLFPEDKTGELFNASTLPTIDFLPVKYTFSSGVAVLYRNMKKSEDTVLYEIWKSAAAKGEGYGLDEIPTLAAFRALILLEDYCAVLEELGTGKVVGMAFIAHSYYTRTSEIKTGESCLFLTDEFRQRQMGREALVLDLGMLKELGFEVSLNDTLSSNLRMTAITGNRSSYWQVVGAIPDGCYCEGYGWDDQIILQCNLDGVSGFLEQAEQMMKRTESPELSKDRKSVV